MRMQDVWRGAKSCEGGEQGLVERRAKDFKGGDQWIVKGESKGL